MLSMLLLLATNSGCDFTFEAYRVAMLDRHAHLARTLEPEFLRCIGEWSPEDGPGLVRYLKSVRAASPSTRTAVYGGAVETSEVIIQAVRVLMDEATGLPAEGVARRLFVSSMARDRRDQERLLADPFLKAFAARESFHLMGLAADVACVGRKRPMSEVAQSARGILRAKMGERAKLIRVVGERHGVLHLELDRVEGRGMIGERLGLLEQKGVLLRAPSSIPPDVAEYRLPLESEQR